MRHLVCRPALLLLLAAPRAAAQVAPLVPPSDSALYATMLAAEDSRAPDDATLEILLSRLTALDTTVRRMAVRALGRLERGDLVSRLAPRLDDRHPGIRAETAHALGQAVYGQSGEDAAGALFQRLPQESDPEVRGAIAQTLGRLRLDTLDAERTVELALAAVAQDPTPAARLGAARGYESLARRMGPDRRLSPESVTRIRALAREGLRTDGRGLGGSSPISRRIRRLAAAALLTPAGHLDDTGLETGLADPDAQVRRITMAALARWDSGGRRV
ncbi:MAG TPA: HEAT repeat domain-containing protein, partial [Gemmatimonadales bacterium]|nr:HEAT repeat domain-containing protein [Gemmatimonadales bacterium]